MKYLFLLLPFLSFSQKDKVLHFAAGSIITTSVYHFSYQRTHNHPKSLLLGLSAGLLAGVAKEVYDPVFDDKDLIATVAGSLSVSITIDLSKQRIKR